MRASTLQIVDALRRLYYIGMQIYDEAASTVMQPQELFDLDVNCSANLASGIKFTFGRIVCTLYELHFSYYIFTNNIVCSEYLYFLRCINGFIIIIL